MNMHAAGAAVRAEAWCGVYQSCVQVHLIRVLLKNISIANIVRVKTKSN